MSLAVTGCAAGTDRGPGQGAEPLPTVPATTAFAVPEMALTGGVVGGPADWKRREPGPDDPDYGVPYGPEGHLVWQMADYEAETPEQTTLREKALDLLRRQCMAEQGFDYVGTAPAEAAAMYPPIIWGDDLIGLVDPFQAAAAGYQNPDYLDQWNQARFAAQGSPETGSDAYEAAMWGGDGCDSRAYRALDPTSGQPAATLPPEINHSVEPAVEADPRVKAAFAAWSQCMAKAGYDFATPAEAYAHDWQEDRDAEIAGATTDLGCKESTGLIPLYRAIYWEHVNEQVEANLPLLQSIQATRQAKLDRYAEILATAE
jgi:hypothetical protein